LINELTRLSIEAVAAAESDIQAFLSTLEEAHNASSSSSSPLAVRGASDDFSSAPESGEPSPIGAHGERLPALRHLGQILGRALSADATHVHLDPDATHLRVRFRIDGLLYHDSLLPRAALPALLECLVAMTDADTSDVPPPCFRATCFVGQQLVPVRVTTVPTPHGENAVLHLLRDTVSVAGLPGLNLEAAVESRIVQALGRRRGMILVAGPGGNGLTTTLHALYRQVAAHEYAAFALEHPVEHPLPGATQLDVGAARGREFGVLLQRVLAQDPDIVLVGALRDPEPCRLAVEAGLAGHLVLSAMHAPDAAAALAQLVGLGVEPAQVCLGVELVLAQRLVRRICESCRHPVPEPETIYRRLNVEPLADCSPQLWQGLGCSACRRSGYKGRQALIELLPLEDWLQPALLRKADAPELRRLCRSHGIRGLFDAGLRLVSQGRTTLDEIFRVAPPGC
jgi:type II secretory ATPase GspE/PulE/Tfp pilus assembly ATPase PilB-like protein